MDVIYAAEKTSIAELLGDYVNEDIRPEEISVVENPSETGSFFVGWRLHRYMLSPGGEIASENARRLGVAARPRRS
ncbi:MAG TPA: hypothetical protein VIC71_14770 [Gammaproteobacteria bacterium]|jgi:hypothetical protein